MACRIGFLEGLVGGGWGCCEIGLFKIQVYKLIFVMMVILYIML